MKRLLSFLLFLYTLSALAHNTEVDTIIPSSYKYNPKELIGKTFYFLMPNSDFVADCFYNEQAIMNMEFSKKNRFVADKHGYTPLDEFINRKFVALRLIPIKGRENEVPDSIVNLNDGFVILLQREDDIIMGLKFNKFKSDREYKRSNPPSFSDLFYISTYKDGMENFFTGKPGKDWSTSISIPTYDVDSIQAACNSLVVPYFQDCVYPGITSKVNGFTLISLNINSNGIDANFMENDSVTTSMNLQELIFASRSRTAAITRANEIQQMVDLYDVNQLNYIRERLVGKSVWAGIRLTHDFSCIYRDLDKQKEYSNYILWRGMNYDRKFDEAKPRPWFENCRGTASTSFNSSYLNVLDGFNTVNVIVEDLILDESFYNGPSGTKYKKRGTISGNDYRFMLVLKQNPAKTYGSDKDESNIRIYIMLDEDDITHYFYSDVENELLLTEARHREQQRNDEWQANFDARFTLANRLWGNEVANIIKKGEVRFGFSSDMCLLSYENLPYHIYYVDTPLGTAVCYDFFQEKNRLFFIDDELIGVQFKLGDIRYK